MQEYSFRSDGEQKTVVVIECNQETVNFPPQYQDLTVDSTGIHRDAMIQDPVSSSADKAVELLPQYMERNLVIKDVYGRVFASAASFTIKKEEMEKQAIWPLYSFPIKSINISIPELEVDDFGLNVKGKENEIIFEREKFKLAHVIHLYDTPLVVYESNRRDYKRMRSARDINTLTIEITDT